MALSAGQVSIAVKPDTASFGSELKSGVLGKVGGVGESMGGMILGGLKTMAGPIAAVTAAFSVKHVLEDSMKAFEDLASGVKGMQRVLGGSAEDVSGLRGAMQLAGVQVDQIQSTLTKFSKNVADAGDKSSTAGKMFAAMGINTKDAHGSLLPMSALLPDIADKFKDMPNGPEKTAAAMALFGRSGAQMIPFLNKGSEGIAELTDKAKAMGLVLDDTSMKIFGEAKESARNFAAAIQGVKVAIGQDLVPVVDAFQNVARNALAPVLQNVAKFMNDNRDSFMKFADMIGGAGKNAMESLGTLLKPLGDAFKQLGPVFTQLVPQIMQLMSAFSPMGLMFKALEPVLPAIISLIASLATSIGTTLAGVLKQIMPPIQAVVTTLVGTLTGVFQSLMPAIVLLAQTLGGLFSSVLQALAPIIVLVVQAVASLIPPLMPLITQIIQLAVQAIVPLIQAIMPLINLVLPILTNLLKFLIPIVTTVAQVLEGVLVVAIQVAINILKFIVTAVTNVISFFGSLGNAVHTIGSVFGSVFAGIGNAVRTAFDGAVDIVKGAINGIIGLVNNAIDGINAMAAVAKSVTGGAINIHVDHIPKLADGGIVPPTPGGRLVRVAEAGQAEAVIPLSKLGSMEGGSKNVTLKYYAAPNDSITAEQKLIDAVQRAKVLGAI